MLKQIIFRTVWAILMLSLCTTLYAEIILLVDTSVRFIHQSALLSMDFFLRSEKAYSNFLGILVAIDTMILGLAIPLVNNTKFKLQKKYKSSQIDILLENDVFFNSYWIKVTLHFFICCLVIAFYNEKITSLEKIVAACLLIFSLHLIYGLNKFIKRINLYESDILNVASKYLKKIKTSAYSSAESFVFFNDLLCDACSAYITEERDVKTLDYLKQIKQLTENFYTSTVPRNSKEYVAISNKKSPDYNPNHKLLRISFPENYYTPARPLHGLLNLYSKAIKAGNTIIAKETINTSHQLLAYLCSIEGNKIEIRYLLNNLYSINTHATYWDNNQHNQEFIHQNNYMGDSLYKWYFPVVFDKYSSHKIQNEYIEIIHDELLRHVKYAISQELFESFQGFISRLVDGVHKLHIHDPTYNNRYNELVRTLCKIAAFLLYKRQYLFLEEFLYHKQPEDSDAIHIGTNIYPETTDDIIKLFYDDTPLHNDIEAMEGHHGIKKYIDMYKYVLLLKSLKNYREIETIHTQNKNTAQEQSDVYCFKVPGNFDLTALSIKNLNQLKNIGIDEQKPDEFSPLINEIFQDNDLISVVTNNEQKNNSREEWKNALTELVKKLRTSAITEEKNRIIRSEIDTEIVKKYKDNIVEAYTDYSTLEKTLNELNLYEENFSKKKKKFGISTVYPKERFLKEWCSRFLDSGKNFGRSLAQEKNKDLLLKLEKKCESTNDSMDRLIKKLGNERDIFVLIHNHFGVLENLEKHGKIQQYRIYSSAKDKNQIFILSKKKFGKLYQYAPNKEEESSNLCNEKISIKIENFSQESNTLTRMLSSSPEWLTKKGDKSKQMEYLLQNVLIEVYESFELKLDRNFKGYIVNFN